MADRTIPPLFATHPNTNLGATRLVHVTAIIRHGARTPWAGASAMKCWDGFWSSPETGVWNCNDLTTTMAVPDTSTDTESFFVFDKRYDALSFPEDGLVNELNGTCQMGQLLLQGYHQELENGKMLRQTYGFNAQDAPAGRRLDDDNNSVAENNDAGGGDVEDHSDDDGRMKLLDLSLDRYLPWRPKYLHWRSDDDQRTVMSGQTLLRGLFEQELIRHRAEQGGEGSSSSSSAYTTINLHIADRDKDILDANEEYCPRLVEIREAAMQSKEYQDFNNSQATKDVREFMSKQLGVDANDSNDILDCLMCTICTDRPLHPAVDDYDGSEMSWFSRVAEYDIQAYTLPMKYNDSQYAKLSLGPLWYEIMLNINPHLSFHTGGGGEDDTAGPPPAPKLAVFSGHDTTLMPLLASIGPSLWDDTDWATYASMMLIEVHELVDDQSDPKMYPSKFAFRLLYNGKIMTPMVEGCHDDCELCDISHLKARIDPIATRDPTFCETTLYIGGGGGLSFAVPLMDLSTPEGMTLYAFFLFISFLTGVIISCCITRRSHAVRRLGGHRKNLVGSAMEEYDSGDLEMHEQEFHDEPTADKGDNSTVWTNSNGH